MLNPFKYRIDGGALYFAILVILLLSIFSSGFMLLNRLWFHENTIFTKITQLNDNLDAAELLIKAQPDMAIPGETRDVDIFSDSSVVNIRAEKWGLLRLVKLSTGWRRLTLERTALYAETELNQYSLYLTDNNKFLSLVGRCFLNGDCFLPELGIRAGEIDGETFIGKKLIDGRIYKSGRMLPQLANVLVEPLSRYWDKEYSFTDSVITINELNRNPISSVSFNSSTNVIDCGKNAILQEVSLSGNIVVIATDTLKIASSARLEDIILIAKTIIVGDNVKGTFQLFAKEKIIIGDNCLMRYPSFAVCLSKQMPAYIVIGKNCSILGGIIIDSDSDNSDSNYLLMSEGDRLTGLVYVNGKVGFSGRVEGSLYCNNFFINTPRAYYENFLKDAVIDSQSVLAKFGSFVLDGKPDKLKMVKLCL
jgi:hypothetical protein